MSGSDASELVDGLLGQVEIEAHIVSEIERIRQIESRLRREPAAQRVFDAAEYSVHERRTAELDDQEQATADPAPILRLMRAAQTAMLRHPTASSLIFNALVEEGRRYAATTDGQARAEALAADPVMAELRRLWEATSLNIIGDDRDDGSGGVPSGWIDLILDTAASADVDDLLGAMRPDVES